MSFLNKFWGNPNTSDTFTFPDVDFDETLFVVDMQNGYINSFLSSDVSSDAKDHCNLLKKNVIAEVENSLNSNGLIVLVEMDGQGETIKGINNLVKQESNRVMTLNKSSDGLASSSNGERKLEKTNVILSGIKEREVVATVRGINTGFCVLQSARGIRDKGIITRVPLGTTLNLNAHAFTQRNNTEWNLGKYRKDSDLLDFGDRSRELPLMSDYL